MRNFNQRFLFFVFLSLISFSGFSQDTIVKFSEEIIFAKINEITPAQVKYKKFDFQDGPLYVLDKSEIKMIRYSNGLKEEFAKEKTPVNNVEIAVQSNQIETYGPFYKVKGQVVNENIVQSILLGTKDKKIMGLVSQAKEAKRLQYIGFVAIPLGIASLITCYASLTNNFNSYGSSTSPNGSLLAISGVCFVGTISCPIISGVYKQKRTNYNRAAIKLYNERF